MNLLSSLRRSQPSPQKPASSQEVDRSDAVIELIYAGHDLVRHLQFPTDNGPECICGAKMNNYPDPPDHARFCPVARFFVAIERARKVAIQ